MVLASSLSALSCMEVAVRIFDVTPRPLAPLPMTSYRVSDNPVLIYEYRPGEKPSDEAIVKSRPAIPFNSAGFYDYEYEREKPEGAYRIVILGDSTTVGFEDPNKGYTKRLEMSLNRYADADIHYEVLNMAVGGYHTMQEVETLRTKGLKYNPDIVLVCLCLNDFALHADGGVYESIRKMNHQPLKNPSSAFCRFLINTSRLAFIINHRLDLTKTTYDQWCIENVLKGKSPVEAGFSLLSELQRKHGFSAYVVVLPSFLDPLRSYRAHAQHRKVVRAVEQFENITLIDLLESFVAIDETFTTFSEDGCHLNSYGHEVMAELLLPIIRFNRPPSKAPTSSGAPSRPL